MPTLRFAPGQEMHWWATLSGYALTKCTQCHLASLGLGEMINIWPVFLQAPSTPHVIKQSNAVHVPMISQSLNCLQPIIMALSCNNHISLNSTGQALVEKHNTSFNLFSAILIFTFNPDQQNWGIIIKQSLKDFTVSSEKSPRLRLLLNLETLKLLPYMAAKIHKKFMCDLVQVCNSHTKRKLNLIKKKTYQELHAYILH